MGSDVKTTVKLRLDKFISASLCVSRREAAAIIRSGLAAVDGKTVKTPDHKFDPAASTVTHNGQSLIYKEFIYIMLNKPAGVICSTKTEPGSGNSSTVLDLMPPEYKKTELFPAGRLDKDTVGFVLLTNDGALAHRLLSPSGHAEKEYYFECEIPLNDGAIEKITSGVTIMDNGEDYKTKPCTIRLDAGNKNGVITLTEGKYHQIKKMFHAADNEITYLKRISFAGVKLDPALDEGQWRTLTDDEEGTLKNAR